MRNFDLFYCAFDAEPTVSTFNSTTVAAQIILPYQGALVQVASTTGFVVGQLAVISDSAAGHALYCTITKIPDSTHIYLLPLQSNADTGGTIGIYTYLTSPAALVKSGIGAPRIANTLVIDLTDAPPDLTYNYLILSASTATTASASTSQAIYLELRVNSGTVGDPYAVAATKTFRYTCPNANSKDVTPFNTAQVQALSAGERYEVSLLVGAVDSDAQVLSSRIVALRYTAGTFITPATGTGPSSTTSFALPSGGTYTTPAVGTTTNYLIVAVGAVQVSNTSSKVGVDIRRNSTPLATINTADNWLMNATADHVTFGHIEYDAMSSTDTLSVLVANTVATAVTIDQTFIGAFPLSGLPALATAFTWLGGGNFNTVSTSGNWTNASHVSSGTITLDQNAKYLEFASWRSLMTAHTDSRVLWGNTAYKDREIRYAYSLPAGAMLSFGFIRNDRLSGLTDTFIQLRPDSGTSAITKHLYLTWFREFASIDPMEDTGISIATDVESGLYHKYWLTTGVTNVYQRPLTDVALINRVIRNGIEMTRSTVALVSGDSADTFFWDATNKIIYVKLASGKKPSDNDQSVVIVASDRLGRVSEDLVDFDGTIVPYVPRIDNVPGTSQELQIRASGVQVASSIGTLDIAAADGAYDKSVARRIFEGLKAKLWRGSSSLSKKLSDFNLLISAIMGLPSLNEKTLRIRLFDKSLNLNQPVATVVRSVYQGAGSSAPTLRDKQLMPVCFGILKRIPAYRISSENSGPSPTPNHFYMVASHYVNKLVAAYLDGTTLTAIASGLTFPNAGNPLTNGIFIYVEQAADGGAKDVIYCDIEGITLHGNGDATDYLLEGPGEIAKRLLSSFPLTRDTGTVVYSTTLITADHVSANAGSIAHLSSVSGFFVGGRYELRDVSNGNHYHGQIVQDFSGTDAMILPLHEPGDSPDGSTYTTGASGHTTVSLLVDGNVGLGAAELVQPSFSQIDRQLRLQRGTDGAIIPRKCSIGLYIDGSQSVTDAMNEICRQSFCYWGVNRAGRVFMDVPDFQGPNAVVNPGLEYDTVSSSRSYWPWRTLLGTTATVSTQGTIRYDGSQSLQFDNASTPDGGVEQTIPISGPGKFTITALASVQSGNFSWARLGFIAPGDGRAEVLSPPTPIVSSAWTRLNLVVTISRAECGLGLLRVHPCMPDGEPTYPIQITGTANLKLWLHGGTVLSSSQPNDLDAVSNWFDKTVNGFAFKNATAINQPVFKKDVAAGKAAVRFDGVDDSLSQSGTVYDQTTNTWTLFVVHRNNEVAAAAVNKTSVRSSSSTPLKLGPRNGFWALNIGGSDIVGPAVVPGAWMQNTALCDGTNTYLYSNGVAATPQAATLIPHTLSLSTVEFFNGDIAELLFYQIALTDIDRMGVETYLANKYGTTPVTLNLDNVETYPVTEFIDDYNSDYHGIDFRDENFFEARVTFNVNAQNKQQSSAIIVSDTEALGLQLSYSEAKTTIPTAARIDLGTPLVADVASARGIAAAIVNYFSRMRAILSIDVFGLIDLPKVGDRLFQKTTARIPNTQSNYPFWMITKIDTAGKNAQMVRIEAERQLDPVIDRADLAPSDIPLGAIVLCFGSACPAQYAEVPELQGFFIVGANEGTGSDRADTVNAYGTYYHTHSLSHTHESASHTHVARVAGGIANSTTGVGLPTGDETFPQSGAFGPAPPASAGVPASVADFSTGASHATKHSHGMSPDPTSITTDATTPPTSSTPTAALNTVPGGNIRSHKRVIFCRRTGTHVNFPYNGQSGFSANTYTGTYNFSTKTGIFIGFLSDVATSIGGWKRETDIDGWSLRGARPTVTAGSTTLAATHVSSNSGVGGSLKLSSLASISLGQYLTITDGGNVYHGIVTSFVSTIPTYEVTVMPITQASDVATGTSFATGSTTVSWLTEVANTSFADITHDHGGAIPSHQHTAGHSHITTTGASTLGPSASAVASVYYYNYLPSVYWEQGIAGTTHTHVLKPTLPTNAATASGSATGTISTSTTVPALYRLVFLTPNSDNEPTVPAGVIIFYDGSSCPSGFSLLSAAIGAIITGAPTATSAQAQVGGHTHTQTTNAHTYVHNHGTPLSFASGYGVTGVVPAGSGGPSIAKAAGHNPDYYTGLGHGHTSSYSIDPVTPVDPGLTAGSTPTDSPTGDDNIPSYKKLLLCKKN